MKDNLMFALWMTCYIAIAIPEALMMFLMVLLPIVQIIINLGMIFEFSLWLKGTAILTADQFAPRFMMCMALNVITPVYTIGVWHLRTWKTERSAWIVAGIALLFPVLTVYAFTTGIDPTTVHQNMIATFAASSIVAGAIAWKVFPLYRRYLKEGPDHSWF